MFNAGSTDGQNTTELTIEDKLVNIVIESVASCNLMSEEMINPNYTRAAKRPASIIEII